MKVKGVTLTARHGSVLDGWYDADSAADAVRIALEDFHAVHNRELHGKLITYVITVATEASPLRTSIGDMPLPVNVE